MKRAWFAGGMVVVAVAATAIVLTRDTEPAMPREPAIAEVTTAGSAAGAPGTASRAVENRPRAVVVGRAATPRAPVDRDAWFDARAVGFERAQRDALEAVALDDAELQVLLAAAAKERAGVDAVSAAALASIRAGAAPPERFDLSGVERPLEALLGERYPTYVLIWLRATVEEFDAIDEGCGDAGCE